jgi:hypothetical protein
MKKFLLLTLLALVSAILPPLASAAIYNVDIDDVTRVELDIDGTPVANLVNGVNAIDMGSSRYLRVMANEGVVFTEVTLVDSYFNEETSWMDRIDIEGGRQYIDLSTSFPEDESFRIRTSGASDLRTASCTVTVDDPSRVRLVRKNSDEAIALQAGAATAVKFDPTNENELILTPEGDKPLYKVMRNDEEVVSGGYSYIIPVADGDRIEIMANYPDVDCSLKFVFADENAVDFIKAIDIDGKPLYDFTAENLSVKLGAGLSITGDTDKYEVTEFTINGASLSFFNPFRLLVEGDLEIRIAVRRYASFEMKVTVDNPERIHVYQGYSYNGNEYTLVPGENTVEVLRVTPIISLVPADGCYIASVKIGNYDYSAEELQTAPVMIGSLTEGEHLEITTGVINRDKTAAIYVEGLEQAEGFFKFMRADQSLVEGIQSGYNTFAFYDGDNRFRLETGAPVASHVYVNDEAFAPEYPESPVYRPVLADGDVLKVFFGEAPSAHTLTLEIHADAEGAFRLVRDRVADITDARGSISALRSTEIAVEPAGDASGLEVTLDGDALTPDADGRCVFSVSGDHHLAVAKKSSGISGVEAVGSDDSVRYYNMQGILIAQPRPGATVIRVQGGKAVKQIVR